MSRLSNASLQPFSTEAPVKKMRENTRLNQYGVDKPVLVFRFDDGKSADYAIYEMLKARKMVGTFALNPGIIDTPEGLTTVQLKSMIADGMEMSNHTMSHIGLSNITSREQAEYEFLTALRIIEDLGCRVDSFTAPGGGGFDDLEFWETWGRIIMDNHLCSAGSYLNFETPIRARYGSERSLTLDGAGSDVVAIKMIDDMIRTKNSRMMLLHPNAIGTQNKVTINEVTQIFDYAEQKRDIGAIEILTLTGGIFATPFGKRMDLIRDGDFTFDTFINSVWAVTNTPTLNTSEHSVTVNEGSFIYQSIINPTIQYKTYGGLIFEYSADIKQTSPGQGVAKVRVYEVNNQTNFSREEEFTVDDTWKTYRHIFTIPTNLTTHTVRVFIYAKDSAWVDVKNIKVRLL